MDHSSSSVHEENLVPSALRRFVPIIGAILVGLALFGYLAGIRDLPSIERSESTPTVSNSKTPAAVTYLEMPSADLQSNPLKDQLLGDFQFEHPGIFDPVVRSEPMKLEALADRARNRAYDGAPPTVPHPVDPLSNASCLSCHGEGIRVGDRVASRMSHRYLSNCTQCHVSQQSDIPGTGGDEGIAEFVGVYRAGAGERASVGAPPTIPHHTWMRDNCAACHGTITRAGTRTTHPWLSNCIQCHAPAADRDPSQVVGR
jgi:cytochrome c-type protein NapB